MKHITLLVIMLGLGLLTAITNDDIKVLMDKELFPILEKHNTYLENLINGTDADISLLLEYAQRTNNPDLAMRCHYRLAMQKHSLKDVIQWISLANDTELDTLRFEDMVNGLKTEFCSAEDIVILDYYLYQTPEDEYLEQIRHLRGYNDIIEDLAKSWIDEVSIETTDSLAVAMIDRFETYFPLSKWSQTAYYFHLYQLSKSNSFEAMDDLIEIEGLRSTAHKYVSALYKMSPTYRKALNRKTNVEILTEAKTILDFVEADLTSSSDILVIYDNYTPEQWNNRIKLTRIKIDYYLMLANYNLLGDEEDISAIIPKPDSRFESLYEAINLISFANNDKGDLAELNCWRGRLLSLVNKPKYLKLAAKSYIKSLSYGAPRKKYDESCRKSLAAIHNKLKVKQPLLSWMRKLVNYKGIVFEELPITDNNYTRIAIGDYDNDGYNDLLFNGNALYHNNNGHNFEITERNAKLSNLISNGALWADFNLDGLLDFATISHDEDGSGETLMKNMDGVRFVSVNERAGDIDDSFPTEGAAWVDIDGFGYPSLYAANYEKWQVRNGYPDFFWHNDKGYFSDKSVAFGFRDPSYTDNPGLAGRGVAPADFDNDNQQEILVTNYRLDRNLCWKNKDGIFTDVAALYGLSGKLKQGYYGHSIGADWGDYDNDGDLDLFVANLAHPRYIEISDISQLLRNDGMTYRVVDADTLFYWQFTDVTQSAGITYDELHSDPLWLDADNDGYLDLFITSVYENDRSYLYRNRGDGTFQDITFLANARIYNGWGNATADLDRDGLTDLVVGSGNGTKFLRNNTPTKNRSLFVKPVWKSDEVLLISDWRHFPQFPNSPAYGTRVKVTVKCTGNKKYSLIRELSSAKGTTSQSSQELHFGISKGKVISIERMLYENN